MTGFVKVDNMQKGRYNIPVFEKDTNKRPMAKGAKRIQS